MKIFITLFILLCAAGLTSLKAQGTCYNHTFTYSYDANGNRTTRKYAVFNPCRMIPEDTADLEEIEQNKWEIDENLEVKAYPNPTRSGFNIRLNRAITQSRVLLYGIKGDLIYNEPFSGRELFIDISGMPAGTYYIRIELPEMESITSKIIKL